MQYTITGPNFAESISAKGQKRYNIGMMTELEKAYIAGIIDGEGTVTLSKSKHGKRPFVTYQIIVRVGSIDKELLLFLRRSTGKGTIRLSKKTITGKDFFEWNILTKQAVGFLDEILPYLRMKRMHALQLLKYYKELGGIRPRKIYKDIQEQRERFWITFRRLNNKNKHQ